MKKTYKKPEIAYDSFEMSGSIAAGCEFISNHAVNQCSYDDAVFGNIFPSEDICVTTPPDQYDSVCYHVPSDSNNLFTS